MKRTVLTTVSGTVLGALAACSFLLLKRESGLTAALLFLIILINIAPLPGGDKAPFRLRVCRHGVVCLRVFLFSSALSLIYHLVIAVRLLPDRWPDLMWSALLCILIEAVIFWNGIISLYLSSVQLGIRMRTVGLVCGCIPVVNLLVLGKMIRTAADEVEAELEKEQLNAARKADQICKTKYPVLFVHGVFFRDFRFLNYWGRIPAELEKNGARVYYGNHQSAASVETSAAEIAGRIDDIVRETGCEKVNIIAHSKGGLDSRLAAAMPCAAGRIASITTINTPHKGCEFAEYLLNKIPVEAVNKIAGAYNSALKKLGDPNPDFVAAVRDLTAARCREITANLPAPEGVLCQSFGSDLARASGGRFPLNFTYNLVKYFDGPNDGLVSGDSFPWGESFTMLKGEGKRGISHGDMIDLNRENIPGFDVREFYVELVSDLKKKGL